MVTLTLVKSVSCVFVIVYSDAKVVCISPDVLVVLLFVIVVVYPSIFVFSITVYVISSPFAFSGKSVNVYPHPLLSFKSTVCTGFDSSPFAIKLTLTESGLIPSWLSLSFHTFSTKTLVFPGVYVLVIVKPADMLPVVNDVYVFGAPSSSTVYVISVPLEYFGKSLNVYAHSFPSPVNVVLCVSVPFAFKINSIVVGRIPS